VVHFSTVPVMEQSFYFPDDLRYALNHPNMPGGLCCSVVKPGDTRDNTFGDVGLIFDLSTSESLIAVSPGDGGATLGPGGVRDFDRKYKNFDLAAVEASVRDRPSNSHNEWGVKDYLVRGLFVLRDPPTVAGPSDTLKRIPLPILYDLFPGKPIYSFRDRGIVEIRPNLSPVPMDHWEIYP
jgi:hypothetical protein